MRYLILFMFLVGVFMFGSRSCNGWSLFGIKGEGPVQTEHRTTGDFNGVVAMISGDVEVRVSDEYSVEVQAQENLLPILKTEVKNGKLKIYFEENVSSSEDLKVRISAPSYDELSLAGSGRLEAFSPIRGESLELNISGSGELLVPEVNVERLSCDIAGSGDLSVSGMSQKARYAIAGSGDIHANDLIAETGKASISGSGSIYCNASDQLEADIAGSGDIRYSGSPSVDSDVSGSGSVKKAN